MHLTVFQLIDQLIELIDQDKKSTADTVLFIYRQTLIQLRSSKSGAHLFQRVCAILLFYTNN